MKVKNDSRSWLSKASKREVIFCLTSFGDGIFLRRSWLHIPTLNLMLRITNHNANRNLKIRNPKRTNKDREEKRPAAAIHSLILYLILYEEDTKKKTIATIIARASLNNIISGFMHRPSVLIEYKYKYNTSATISIVTGRGAFLLGPQEAGRSGLQHSTAQTKI